MFYSSLIFQLFQRVPVMQVARDSVPQVSNTVSSDKNCSTKEIRLYKNGQKWSGKPNKNNKLLKMFSFQVSLCRIRKQ